MTYATGWTRVAREPDIIGNPGDPYPIGPRYAVHPDTGETLCGVALAHVDTDQPFGTGGLGTPPCQNCVDQAA